MEVRLRASKVFRLLPLCLGLNLQAKDEVSLVVSVHMSKTRLVDNERI